LNRDLLAQLDPVQEQLNYFSLGQSGIYDFSKRGGLDPVTGGLWLTDIAHHHLAIAILFLIAGHMYSIGLTNWGGTA
jgi:photosystem I P700 chlorophyll a apoprotein A1